MNEAIKVWIVDDDPVYHILSASMFQEHLDNASLENFKNGLEALRELEKRLDALDPNIPEVILLDLSMPVMDGWEFLSAFGYLKFNYKKPKVYLLSSTIDPADHRKAKQTAEVSEIFVKPIAVDTLKSIVTVRNK